MDHHGDRRIPLAVLYGFLIALFTWALLFRIPMTKNMYEFAFRPDTVTGLPLLPDWPDGEITFVARDLDAHATAPIRRGDRLVSVDGLPFETPAQWVRRVMAAGPSGTLSVVVDRKGNDGRVERIESSIGARSVAQGEHVVALRVLAIVLGLITPWACLIVGFWVAAVRPRDPMAWLVLTMLLGFSQVASVEQYTASTWPDGLRIPGAFYTTFFGGTWPISFALFGAYFAGRLQWERRFGWVKWIVLAPMLALTAVGIGLAYAECFEVRSLAPLARTLARAAPFGFLAAAAAVTFFFLVMGWKRGVEANPDARRRLRLLFWGGTVALTPLLGLVLFIVATQRPLESLPIAAIVGCLIVVPIFPLTLAYVILVDRAMDVRVVVRQGLRYAATRGAIRTLIAVFMLGVVWNLWNLVNDPTANRPRKLQAIAWSIAAALFVPRFAKRALDWTDRRFFREACDAEHMLTSLSEEVRTIVETEPLLDTVVDRIAATLHVDRLAVFLLEGAAFVPACSRGFDPPPSVSFPVTADALQRLRVSGRPFRVRHDDSESPLRRETISEENRSRLAQLDAEILLPLTGRKDLLGVITLGPKKSEEPYSLSDAKLLGLVATQTGLALENSRLTATIAHEIAKRERMSREIEIARDVQQKLFPQRLPEIAGVDCAGFCRPAQGVGGDYYDFLALPGGRLGVALGDVAGKGIPAALLMASLQASLRGQRLSGPANLAQLMTNLNYLIYEASPDNRYATFFYGEFDPAARRLDYVNAGHNAPMLFRAAGGTLERLPASGPVIGLLGAGRFEQRSVELHPGDLLLVFSDGISEAMNDDEEEWGEHRLAVAARAAAPCDAQALIDTLFVAADAFVAGATQHDDMTVVVVRVER